MLAAVLLLLVLASACLLVRRRQLARVAGSFDCSVSVGGRPWSSGVARYGRCRVEWWRLLSLSPLPQATWERDDLDVVERRWPQQPPTPVGTVAEAVIVRCAHRGAALDLAMSPDAYTGFASWLEARPPGPQASVT